MYPATFYLHKTQTFYVRFQVLVGVKTSMLVLSIVMQCELVGTTNVSEEHTASIFSLFVTTSKPALGPAQLSIQ
jgi:hypothetical protein